MCLYKYNNNRPAISQTNLSICIYNVNSIEKVLNFKTFIIFLDISDEFEAKS